MPVAYVASDSQDKTWLTAGAPVTFNFDLGSTANRFAALLANNRDVSSSHWRDTDAKINGVSMTPFGPQFGSVEATRGYWAVALPSGVQEISMGMLQDFANDVEGIVSIGVWDGVDQVSPYTGYVTGTGTDATAETSAISSAAGRLVIGMMGSRTFNSSTMTLSGGTSRTKRWDNRFNDCAAAGGDWEGGASVSPVITDDEGAQIEWDMFACSLNEAPTSAPGLVIDYSDFPKPPITLREAA